MNIVFSTDNNYVFYSCVMLTSLFENNNSVKISVYVLTEGLTDSNIALLSSVVTKYGGRFCYCLIDRTMFSNCPIRKDDHVTLATYFRFLIPKILPASESKAIYLDVDMIITKDISFLWHVDIDNYGIAAVDEIGCYPPDVFVRLGILEDNSYFNAGMLVINLNYWRENKITEQLFDCVNCMFDKLLFHDQDALNVVLNDKWLSIPARWNWQTSYMYRKHKITSNRYNEVLDESNHISILHFTEAKPWNTNYIQPYTFEFYYYQRKLGLPMRYSRMKFSKKMKMYIRPFMEKLRLISPLYSDIFAQYRKLY